MSAPGDISVKEYELRRGPFGSKRKLILSPEYVEYKGANDNDTPIRVQRSEIVDFKHGMDWIVWYRFTVGRRFMITFKAAGNRELRINFASFFGLDRHLNQSYADIVEDIWQFYHQGIVDRNLERLRSEEELLVKGFALSNRGIRLNPEGPLLTWDRLGIKEYYSYFALLDKDNPMHHARVAYNEWETEILWSLVKTLTERSGSD